MRSPLVPFWKEVLPHLFSSFTRFLARCSWAKDLGGRLLVGTFLGVLRGSGTFCIIIALAGALIYGGAVTSFRGVVAVLLQNGMENLLEALLELALEAARGKTTVATAMPVLVVKPLVLGVATDSGIFPCVLLDYEFVLVGEVGLTFANRSSRLALQLLRELQQSAHHTRFFVKTSRCRLRQCLVLLLELRRVQQVTKFWHWSFSWR